MTSKDLSKLIREFVRKEIEHQKADIIKEVKAEMFDVMMSSNNPRPQLQTESVQIGTGTGAARDTTAAEMSREQLRTIMQQKLGTSADDDTFNFNTQNVDPVASARLPDTFQGGAVTEKHHEVLDAMNKDYGNLMKKMGI